MINISILIYALILDTTVIISARKIILDFLRGVCSKKRFRQIIKQQSFFHKLSLSFIIDYINNPDYRKPYLFYKYLYYTFLSICPVKDLALFFRECFNLIDPNIVVFINYALCIIFVIIFSFEAPGKRYSRYAGRKYNKIS